MLPIKDDIPTQRTPVITIALIVINCLVYLYELMQGSRGYMYFTHVWGLIPVELTTGVELTPRDNVSSVVNLFTSMFMHGGIVHLGGNMLYLWIFGNNIEDRLGRVKFVLFYLASGIVAALSFIATDPHSDIPLVGASGAIAGVLGAYLLSYPRARVVTVLFIFYFIRVARIPALFVLGFWFVLQILNGLPALGSSGSGGVAWFAHIGGFVFGLIVFRFFVKKEPYVYYSRDW
jgi:membrane associated rhomboid family serine protease